MHCQYGPNHILFRYPVHHPLFPRVAVTQFLSLALIVVERNTHRLKNKVWEGDVFNMTLQKCLTFRSCPSKGNSFIFRNICYFLLYGQTEGDTVASMKGWFSLATESESESES